jgi:hypothetical protein
MTEHDEQSALIAWAAVMATRYPELNNLFAIPNAGKRSFGAARYYQDEGMKAGVPDLFLAVARRVGPRTWQHGLFIEFKYGRNDITPIQQDWIIRLQRQSYGVYVCHSLEDAKQVICPYLGIEEEQ